MRYDGIIREHWLYGLFFLSLLVIAMASKDILSGLSHLYQHGYRCWDVDYAGLGTSEVVHFFCRQGEEEYRVFYRREDYCAELEKVLFSLPAYVEKEGKAVEFLHASRTTYIFPIGDTPYVIKLSRKKPLFESIFFLCRHSRAAWNNAALAHKIGFPTIRPLALVEVGTRFQFTSYLVYQFTGKTLREKEATAWEEPFKNILAQQKELWIIHPDFRPKNVIQLDNGAIQYIDIDDLHRYSPASYICRARFAKELKRFEKNMEKKDFRVTISL